LRRHWRPNPCFPPFTLRARGPLGPAAKGGFPLFGKEGLGEISRRICILNYGLLTNLEDFNNRYHCDLFTEKKKMLNKLQEEGFISIQDGHLHPTPTGFAVADSVSLI